LPIMRFVVGFTYQALALASALWTAKRTDSLADFNAEMRATQDGFTKPGAPYGLKGTVTVPPGGPRLYHFEGLAIRYVRSRCETLTTEIKNACISCGIRPYWNLRNELANAWDTLGSTLEADLVTALRGAVTQNAPANTTQAALTLETSLAQARMRGRAIGAADLAFFV